MSMPHIVPGANSSLIRPASIVINHTDQTQYLHTVQVYHRLFDAGEVPPSAAELQPEYLFTAGGDVELRLSLSATGGNQTVIFWEVDSATHDAVRDTLNQFGVVSAPEPDSHKPAGRAAFPTRSLLDSDAGSTIGIVINPPIP